MSDGPPESRYAVALDVLTRAAQIEPESQVTEREHATTRATGDGWELEVRRALLEVGG